MSGLGPGSRGCNLNDAISVSQTVQLESAEVCRASKSYSTVLVFYDGALTI